MTDQPRRRGFATRAIHAELSKEKLASRAISIPIHQTASFAFEHSADIASAIHDPENAHVYSRLSNPTVSVLERAIADLEGTESGLAFSSGMAAIHGVLSTLC